ncbi:RhuM family protein [Streptomyces sp. NPDC020607]|uniref:RhuM family protein n=1 Tax=Streptomyces sp. NPDC020607 TaxID=3365082 RepID=UPI003792B0E9
MAQPHSNKLTLRVNTPGTSPFDGICHLDTYGREHWSARQLMTLMGYARWEDFAGTVIDRAIRSAKNTGTYSDQAFSVVTERATGGRTRSDYHPSRGAAYLVALNGDPKKRQVADAQVYFTVRTREAELGAITTEEIRQTALARAREMIDYRAFRDMMAENAPDYDPGSRATRLHFAVTQNKLYRHITGMTADEIKNSRTLQTWPGREEGKAEPSVKSAARKIAKNYLTVRELKRLDRLIGRLCLAAEDIADDGMLLALSEWDRLVEEELALAYRQIAA